MTRQGWLVSDGIVMAAAEVAASRAERNRGLLGRHHFDGAFVLPNTRWVHTVGMHFPIDVAHLDSNGAVVHIEHLRRNRIGRPVLRSDSVVEAAAGSFERWGVKLGATIEVRE
jgi:uncharacterized membrane protein (UPF0127 family)